MPFDPPSESKSPAPSPDAGPPELRVAALLGLLGVAAGAFGAHALRAKVGEQALGWWETGARYHMIHAAVMLAVTLAPGANHRWRRRSAKFFAIGICIFAGTLYAMTLGAPTWFGAITPLGGLMLMFGWASLLVPLKDK